MSAFDNAACGGVMRLRGRARATNMHTVRPLRGRMRARPASDALAGRVGASPQLTELRPDCGANQRADKGSSRGNDNGPARRPLGRIVVRSFIFCRRFSVVHVVLLRPESYRWNVNTTPVIATRDANIRSVGFALQQSCGVWITRSGEVGLSRNASGTVVFGISPPL